MSRFPQILYSRWSPFLPPRFLVCLVARRLLFIQLNFFWSRRVLESFEFLYDSVDTPFCRTLESRTKGCHFLVTISLSLCIYIYIYYTSGRPLVWPPSQSARQSLQKLDLTYTIRYVYIYYNIVPCSGGGTTPICTLSDALKNMTFLINRLWDLQNRIIHSRIILKKAEKSL